MVEQAFEAAEIDWRFLTFEVPPTKLVDALRGVSALGFSGAVLLPSLQRPSWEHVTTHTDRAEKTRSVSCLFRKEGRLVGEDLSGESVTAAILRSHPVVDRHAALLGVGGRGASTARALMEQGVASLRIIEYGDQPAGELTSQLAEEFPDRVVELLIVEDELLDLPDEVNLLISSSYWPSAEDGRVAELLASRLRPNMVVVDARAQSAYTPLLHDAAECGAPIVTGIQILACEVAEAIRLWTGLEPPMNVLQDSAEEFLGV